MIDRRIVLLTGLLAAGCQDAASSDEPFDDSYEQPALAQAAPAPSNGVRQPEYDQAGALIRPRDVETWVYLGTGVNLNYVEGGRTPSSPTFLTTAYMEPSAYRQYKATGVFPEGTMTALLGYRAGSGLEPAKTGQFLGDNLMFEMSVKDATRNPADVWTYWAFARGAERGEAHPAARCHACHAEHAQTDFVFTQFYPNLRKPAPSAAR